MERTQVFLRRHMERIGTVGRENDLEEGYFLRSERHMYHRGISSPFVNKSTCQPERQEANAADHFNETRTIHQLKREIMSLDRTVTFLEERLEYRRDRDEKLVYKLQEKDKQIYDLKDQLLQTETLLNEKTDATSDSTVPLKIKLQHQDREIKNLQEILESKNTEMSKRKENYSDKLLHEENGRLSTETEQSLQIRSVKETTLNKHIALQEAEIECRNKQVRELEIILDSKLIEISQCKELLKLTVDKKDIQFSEQSKKLHQTSAKLQETEAKMDKAVSFLKEKNQHLQAEVERCNEKVKNLEEMLDSKRTATNDENTRQAHRVMKQKDNEILDLRHQLKQTLMALERKESEMNKIIASLKKKTQDLENDVEHRDMKNQHLQADVERCNEKVKILEEMLDSKRTPVNDGDKRQSYTVMRQKDDQISDLRHQLKQTLDRKESEMNEMIASLKKKTQDLENEVEHRDMTIKDLSYKKNQTSDRNELLEKKVKEKDCQLYKERDQRQHAFEKMQEKKSEMEGIIASLKTKAKLLEEDIEHRNLKIKHLEEELNSKTIGVSARKEANRDVTEMGRKITKLTDELNQTLTNLHETNTETDETKTRRSKAMGNMLTVNNPNIADLSDKYRPTKLSERYTELYDNQWTDAFDILEKHFHTEENAVAALLQILKDAMIFCRNKAYEQMEDLQRVLALSNDKEDEGISTDLGTLVKDCRKTMPSVAIRNLYLIYMSHINQSTDKTSRVALQVSSFTKECLEVCWYMVIQDPPIVFAPEPGKGSNLNTDLFKPYRRSGTYVDYVVWPALLLHEGGPVLAKGVAQVYCKT